jgi:REP element-mobilizing transposase RayT
MINKERKTNRSSIYNYCEIGYYFITFCINKESPTLGVITEDKIRLNEIGKLVEKQINWTESHFNNIKIISYIIMPNHVHLIIFINGEDVGTTLGLSLQDKGYIYKRRYSIISKVISALKTTASKQIHKLGYCNFSWQRSFYDRVIRNDKELENIRKYIYNNLINWKQDKYF